MALPDSTFAVVALIVLLIPGLVYALVRTSLRGFRADDKGIDTRIAQALLVSVVLDAIYLIAGAVLWGGSAFKNEVRVTEKAITILDPIALGFTILVFAVTIPAVLSALIYFPFTVTLRSSVLTGIRDLAKSFGSLVSTLLPVTFERSKWYTSDPTAWDYAATAAANRFVRILLPDGRYVGGWYGPRSYVSTYPEPRDIFISFPYEMEKDGKFGARKADSDGVWITIPDGAVVEWVLGPAASEDDSATTNEGNQND